MVKENKVWKKVVMWVCESFEADNDEEAIKLVKDGDYWTEEVDYGDEYVELYPDENGVIIAGSSDSLLAIDFNNPGTVPYPITQELYDKEGELIWDNKPLKVKRDEKITKILE